MKNRAIHLLLGVACVLWLMVSGNVCAQSARVAVAGDPSLENLIDVTTAQLSTEPGLAVLERADLDKLGQEQALQSVLGSNDFSPVRLLPADGLVLLRAVKQDGKVGVFARLVAVQPGVILREVALPDNADPPAQAQALVKEFAPYWSKLAAIQKGKIAALSLLGLRFEVDAPETRELERSINVLLASRLSAEPDTLVLERWRLNDAVFEKSLNAQQPAPFWTGSSLIDGSMKWADNHIEVTLRMRPPQGAEVSLSDQDTADHLPALVGRLADKVRNHPISQEAWNPSAEADHFAELGKWCLDNHLYDEGAEAIESALALGDTSRMTKMLQIRAYALLAYPDDLRDLDSSYGPDLNSITADSLGGQLQSGVLAADLTFEYLKMNHDFSGPSGTLEDPVELSLPVLNNCLRALRVAYDKGFQRTHGDEVADLRHEVQKLIAQMDQLMAGKPSDKRVYFLKYKIRYAAFWHETPEETLAYYRELLNRKTDGVAIREELFVPGYPILHAPYLDADSDLEGTPVWYLGSPWIVAWDDRSPAEIKAVWQNFVKELANSSDPVLQADAFKFEFGSIQTEQMRNDVGAQVVAFLQQDQENIYGPRGNDFVTGFFAVFQWAARRENQIQGGDLRDLYETLYKKHVLLASEWIKQMSLLFYYKSSSEESRTALAVFDDYRKWYQTQAPQNPDFVTTLEQTRKSFYDANAEGAVQKALAGFLPVHQHWPTPLGIDESGSPNAGFPMIDSRTLMVEGGKVWFVAKVAPQLPHLVLCVDPASMQTIASFPIPDQYDQASAGEPGGCSLDVSGQWLAVAINGHALLCSRTGNQWRALDVPPTDYKPRWIDQNLYLLYDYKTQDRNYETNSSGAASAVSGLIHVSIPDAKIENVVSSRRIPSQNSLDGKPLGYPLEMWNSPAGLMLAFDFDSPHFQVFGLSAEKNDWVPVAADPLWCDVKVGAGGALIGKGFDDHGFVQLTLMNGLASQLLLSNPDRAKTDNPQMPAWNTPEEIRMAPSGEIWQASPVMRGEDLCLYRNVLNGTGDGYQACLYYFAKGRRDGFKIPLAFNAEGMTNPAAVRIQSAIFSYQSVQATDYGLIVGQVMHGFWVIPWHDIDAYRSQLAAGTIPVAAEPTPVTQDNQPSPVGAPKPTAVVTPSSTPTRPVQAASTGND